MKKLLVLVMMLFTSALADAQILHPVKWAYAAKRTGTNEATVFLKATIADGWHIYSAYQKEGGPVKTSFIFGSSTAYQLVGDLEEPAPITHYEEAFKMDVSYFQDNVVFRQKIKIISGKPAVAGSLRFMVCNDQQCLAPETIYFNIPVK